jgi:hypothetical protein
MARAASESSIAHSCSRAGGRNIIAQIVVPMRFAPGAPRMRIEFVAQNGEEPRFQIGSELESLPRTPGLRERLLRQIFCNGAPAAQHAGKRPQMRDQRDEFALELGGRLEDAGAGNEGIRLSSGTHERTSIQDPAATAD